MSEAVKDLWIRFCTAKGVDAETPYQTWYFGNSTEMAAELAALVISGKKFATASLAETNLIKPDEAPVADGISIVTNFAGEPLCVIQTVEIRHIPFREVDAQFAADEGEGDQSLEYWRRVHAEYFTKEAAALGFDFNENSLVCCERFKLLFT